jgi:hypothetical protein
MNNESPFSAEYNITGATEAQQSAQETTSLNDINLTNDIFRKIESDYNLSKPRRKIIRARILTR